MNIAVLLGGTSPERHVSMASGKGIAEALISRGHTVTLYDPARGSEAHISFDDVELPTEQAPSDEELATLHDERVIEAVMQLPSDLDIVFMALHGAPGEDGSVQAMLDLRRIPYTGSGPLSSAVAMDKAMSKRLMELVGVPTADWFVRPSGTASAVELADLADRHTGYPVVVKPNDGGSTVGMTIVDDESGLMAAYELAGGYSTSVLFEEFIAGRELTVTILGDQSLPIVEIRPKSGFYDYKSKYTAGMTEYICPAELPRAIEEELSEMARRVHVALQCSGYSRVDFRLDESNSPYCLEANTLPGMTATSLVPKAARAAGMDFPSLCERIIELGIASRRRTERVTG